MYASLARIGVAVILVWFAVYGIEQKRAVPPVPQDAPSKALMDKVAPVANALRSASAVDRALWAEVWEKAAKVVAGDADSGDVVFTDTKALRAFTVLCLDLAWHRVGSIEPGRYDGLQEATEAFLADPNVLGQEEVPVTPEVRRKFCEAAKALAYAGMNRG